MRALLWFLLLSAVGSAQVITVRFPAARSAVALDGRLLLLLSNDPSEEPRMQIDDTPKSQMVFGVTVDGWKPGESITVGDNAQGYPRASLKDVPPGDYTIQAVLNEKYKAPRRVNFLIGKDGRILEEQIDDAAIDPSKIVDACERPRLKQ